MNTNDLNTALYEKMYIFLMSQIIFQHLFQV